MTALAKAESRGEAGGLRVGFYTSLSGGYLRASLVDYVTRYPEVSLTVVESSRADLFTELEEAVLDIVIVSGEVKLSEAVVLPLWAERIIVALPEQHRLAAREIVYWTDLKSDRILLSCCDPGPEIRNLLLAKLAAPGDRPLIDSHNVSREAILSMVGTGRGVTLLFESSTGASYAGVVYREARDGNGPSWIGQSACWRGDNANPALLRFVEMLKARLPSRG